jgi:hypothetical protein
MNVLLKTDAPSTTGRSGQLFNFLYGFGREETRESPVSWCGGRGAGLFALNG